MDLTFQSAPKNGQHFATTTTSARNSAPISSDSVTVHASADVYLKAGNSGVVASSSDYDMHLIAGAYVQFPTRGATHIAAVRVSADGAFYINEEK